MHAGASKMSNKTVYYASMNVMLYEVTAAAVPCIKTSMPVNCPCGPMNVYKRIND